MFRTTRRLNFNRFIARDILTMLTTGAGGPDFGDFWVHLLQTAIAIGPTSDITIVEGAESTFAGYTSKHVNAAGLAIIGGEIAEGTLWPVSWVADTNIPEAPQTAYAYYLSSSADPATGVLLGGEVFDEPVPFANVGDFLILNLILPFMFGQDTAQ